MLHELLRQLTEIFCELDDLAQKLEEVPHGHWLSATKGWRGGREETMHPSALATILLP